MQASNVLDLAMLGIPQYDELIRMTAPDVQVLAPQPSHAAGKPVASAKPTIATATKASKTAIVFKANPKRERRTSCGGAIAGEAISKLPF